MLLVRSGPLQLVSPAPFYKYHDMDDEQLRYFNTGYLARVILLDQFSRCIYRASPEAFQYDTLTASLVKDIVERGWFTAPGVFVPIQRFFLGVAIQHSEDIEAQRLGVKLANDVAAGAGEDIKNWVTNLHGYPMQHHDVIAQFGRFPGRNDALVSTSVQ